jgi:hypothetical protein
MGVEQHQLAPPPGLGERVPDQRAGEATWGGAPSPVTGVDHPHPGNVALKAFFRQVAIELDLEDFGHGRDRTGPAGAGLIWWTPCHPKSHSGPSSSPKW